MSANKNYEEFMKQYFTFAVIYAILSLRLRNGFSRGNWTPTEWSILLALLLVTKTEIKIF